jgi:hypothetical protein
MCLHYNRIISSKMSSTICSCFLILFVRLAQPSDPSDTSNIISQLNEGQIVTSTRPPRGNWIRHDAGGWSISKHGGFTWLEPIDE